MSATMIPFLDSHGAFHAELVPTSEIEVFTNDNVGGLPQIEEGKTLGNTKIELRYGVFSVVQLIAANLEEPPCYMPTLTRMLATPLAFQNRIAEIVNFYSEAGNGANISSLGAYNYLRIALFGGNKGSPVASWLSGLRNGYFLAADGETVLGQCIIVPDANVKNNLQDDKGYWKQPQFMFELNKEFKNFRNRLLGANSFMLATPDWRGECALFMGLLNTVQGFFFSQLRDVLNNKEVLNPMAIATEHITADGFYFDIYRSMAELPFILTNVNAGFRFYIREREVKLEFVQSGTWLERTPVNFTKGINKWFKVTPK